jgi:hypothetical protein
MAKVRFKPFPPGARLELQKELQQLHSRRGYIGGRILSWDTPFGYPTFHRALHARRVAEWAVVSALVTRMLALSGASDADREIARFQGLWDEADREDGEDPGSSRWKD